MAERNANWWNFELAGARLCALGSGALHWPDRGLLCVSDLHLGRFRRGARFGGAVLPPYETTETLLRLEADLDATRARTVICLGDSFDDDGAPEDLEDDAIDWITRLQAGREWVWIEGNHDAGGTAPGGSHRAQVALGPLVFRHIAEPGAAGEVSGHFHPKAVLTGRGGRVSRPCFLVCAERVILPAYGASTGGLAWTHAAFRPLLGPGARAILTGPRPAEVPFVPG